MPHGVEGPHVERGESEQIRVENGVWLRNEGPYALVTLVDQAIALQGGA